jgi:hypothetical protein
MSIFFAAFDYIETNFYRPGPAGLGSDKQY